MLFSIMVAMMFLFIATESFAQRGKPFSKTYKPAITDDIGYIYGEKLEDAMKNGKPMTDFYYSPTANSVCNHLAIQMERSYRLKDRYDVKARDVPGFIKDGYVDDVTFPPKTVLNWRLNAKGECVSELNQETVTYKCICYVDDGLTNGPLALVKVEGSNGPCFNNLTDLRPAIEQEPEPVIEEEEKVITYVPAPPEKEPTTIINNITNVVERPDYQPPAEANNQTNLFVDEDDDCCCNATTTSAPMVIMAGGNRGSSFNVGLIAASLMGMMRPALQYFPQQNVQFGQTWTPFNRPQIGGEGYGGGSYNGGGNGGYGGGSTGGFENYTGGTFTGFN